MSAWMFVVSILLLGIVSILWAYRGPKNFLEYIKTKDGKGVLKGIILFVSLGIVLVIFSAVANADTKGKWFAWGELFMGLDQTFNQSPMCHDGDYSDKITSNGGLRINVFESGDSKFSLNGKYTHHSCAFNPDDASYDALGIEATYKLW